MQAHIEKYSFSILPCLGRYADVYLQKCAYVTHMLSQYNHDNTLYNRKDATFSWGLKQGIVKLILKDTVQYIAVSCSICRYYHTKHVT